MNENNELNDIILNKNGSTNSNKKIILAVATLGVILIIVVMLMNSLSSSGTDNLPKAVLPPQPQTQALNSEITQEPLFEEIEVTEEPDTTTTNLEEIAQKLKEESAIQEEVPAQTAPSQIEKPMTTPTKVAPKKVSTTPKTTTSITYYVQVGSFSKYEPNKKFLQSITSLGFDYKYHKAGTLNKVLVGPFKSEKDAKDARRVLRAKVEPGSFLVRL